MKRGRTVVSAKRFEDVVIEHEREKGILNKKIMELESDNNSLREKCKCLFDEIVLKDRIISYKKETEQDSIKKISDIMEGMAFLMDRAMEVNNDISYSKKLNKNNDVNDMYDDFDDDINEIYVDGFDVDDFEEIFEEDYDNGNDDETENFLKKTCAVDKDYACNGCNVCQQ